ncbi:glycosyltransferase family 2 protein [Catenovulum sediminis]|uniref:Glycosyltransferase family A protein n=1 Tax=Catenovulum sediminis TaxID=1740262 RepID=A0ABV1RMJ0_9ALTE|nr:glycosyltransferase family A protein [Catenovulum sediminis]
MTTAPLISIVIPLYNKESVIARTISSIESQTYRHYEIIVVDDGSTDNSVSIVKDIMKVNNKIVLLSQSNAGPGRARNLGLASAKGELISFLDADDEYMPSFLQTAVECFSANSNINIFASAHYCTVQGEAKSFADYFLAYDIPIGQFDISNCANAYCLLGLVWFHHSSSVVCQTEIVKKYGGYYDNKRSLHGEDSYLWLQIILNETGYNHIDPLVWYHTEDSGLIGGGNLVKEMPAYLADPAKLIAACPQASRALLDDLMAIFSLIFIYDTIDTNKAQLQKLINAYPSMQKTDDYNNGICQYADYINEFEGNIRQSKLLKLLNGPKEKGPWH